jgi:hemerythrin-like domain-containing protein
MSTTLDKLHQEHINTAKLMDVLENQIKLFQENGYINFQLIRDITEYIISYPDLYHHPKEDHVFELLRHKDKEIETVINHLLEDHKTLTDSAINLTSLLNELKDNHNPEKLIKPLQHYVDLTRAHMDIEETKVFPKAKELLTEDDWQQIEAGFNNVEDPLFGKVIHKQYENTFNSIIEIGSKKV